MKTRIGLSMSGIVLLLLTCNVLTANSQSFGQAVERAKPTVVMIRTYDAFGKLNTIFGSFGGSGIIIDKDKGYILTNYHVIAHEEADFILATFLDDLNGRRSFKVTVVGYDHLSDLAVLEINPEKAPPLSEIEWGDSDNLQIGEPAIAIGYPHLFSLQGSQQESVAWKATDTDNFLYEKTVDLFQPTVSVGVVSATDKISLGEISGKEYLHIDLIQTDASINGGNSGGALVNKKGQLIGINTWGETEGAGSIGINFAISANTAKKVYNQLIDFGYVRPIHLGLKTEPLNFKKVANTTNPVANGIRVSSVTVDSSAAYAGIKKGDVITTISGQPIKNDLHFKAIERLLLIGKKVTCTVIQDDKHKKVVLEPGVLGASRSSNYTVTQPDRKKLENYTHRGVIVTHVIPDSVLGREGLKPDDLIYQINHRKIHSLEDYVIFRDMLTRGRTIPMRYHIERRIGQNSWYRFIDFNNTSK